MPAAANQPELPLDHPHPLRLPDVELEVSLRMLGRITAILEPAETFTTFNKRHLQNVEPGRHALSTTPKTVVSWSTTTASPTSRPRLSLQGDHHDRQQTSHGDGLDVEELSETNERRVVPRGRPVPRTATDLAAAAQTLLDCSSQILLVDQYYSGMARFGRPLTALIRCASAGNPLKRFEYHLGSNNISAEFFQDELDRQRPYLRISVERAYEKYGKYISICFYCTLNT